MSAEGSITQWLEQVKQADEQAAQQIWQRYYQRLIALARKKLSDSPRRAMDEEDVVLSAFNNFFAGAETGRFPQLTDRNDLWRVLVTLTANKAINQRKHEWRQKRGGGHVRGESVFTTNDDEVCAGIEQVSDGEPTPEFAERVAEECRELLERLADKVLQKTAIWKMEGYTNKQIADRFGYTERTVERKLKVIRTLWSQEEYAG